MQAVASLASLTGLEDLRLADCGAITNNGMDVLSSLTRLTALAVVRCPRLADKGLALLTRLPHLRHLDITGCSKVRFQCLASRIQHQVPCLTAHAESRRHTLQTGQTGFWPLFSLCALGKEPDAGVCC